MMTNLVTYSILLVFLVGVSLAQDYDDYSTTGLPLSTECTLDGIDIFSIPKGDAYIVNATIYDNIKSDTLVSFKPGRDATYQVVDPPNRYVTKESWVNRFRVKPIDEKSEISQPGHTFYYNFTLSVRCDGIYYPVDALIPIHETNTYTPVFSNKIYEYALFSPFNEDLQRLIELNPIVANDNDISNTEVIFGIEANSYFDLQYEGVVPGSLNKNHSAKLIPKFSDLKITQNLEFNIYVTDLGYPPKSSNATIILKPLNIKTPTFKEPYYVGDCYANNTFVMRSQPELDITGMGENYKIAAAITGNVVEYDDVFYANVTGNGVVMISKASDLPEITVHKYNYLLYTLTVSLTDTSFDNYMVEGNATVVIEVHPQ